MNCCWAATGGTAATAATQLADAIGYRQARHTEGKVWAGHAKVALLLAGDPLELRRADRLNNLATLYRDIGRKEEAGNFLERALEIWEGHLGDDHPIIAQALNNLMVIRTDPKRFEEAEGLAQKTLDITERTFAPDHPYVAVLLGNYARLLRETHRKRQAKHFRRQARSILRIHEKQNQLDQMIDISALVNTK